MSSVLENTPQLPPIPQRLATELGVSAAQITATIALMDEGSTVPFIARYRKEATGGLDDAQLRLLDERLRYLRELEERRDAILDSVKSQDKLTPALEKDIRLAETKTRLEDLYLPYKPKRRTKAQIAREAGLEPLADQLFNQPDLQPEELAAKFLNEDAKITDTKAALEGAKHILAERFSEDAQLVGQMRTGLQQEAKLISAIQDGKEQEGAKFADYFDYAEPISKIPSHRALAFFRGRNEGALSLKMAHPQDEGLSTTQPGWGEQRIANHFHVQPKNRPADQFLSSAVKWAWRVKLSMQLENDLFTNLREQAEEEAIRVFATNLKDLLLAAPAGMKTTIGLDPGIRTGVKVAVVDPTGKLLDTTTIYPHAPRNQWRESIAVLAALAQKHQVDLVAIGNGTASRETDKLVADLMASAPELKLTKIMVSEAGASVYSASEAASKELPDLDVSLRGAVSIARRLQDPLAELVKIDPKSIGVGQYQHDVSQTKLARSLEGVVEDCVNSVGVDVNTASPQLLKQVAGLSDSLSQAIVDYRNQNGSFTERRSLTKVPRLGPKAFEQCAGFLRIPNGDNPLDASAVHPEAYTLVERIAKDHQKSVQDIIGDSHFLRQIKAEDYVDDHFGLPTIRDILAELEKPGRDPRPEFKTATFKEGVETLNDLKLGMKLEAVITNVTNFGAFADIGVHQDGLIHVSQLADKFIEDPRQVVKAGDLVNVTIIGLDIPRKRISMSMRSNPEIEGDSPSGNKPTASVDKRPAKGQNRGQNRSHKAGPATPAGGGALAEAMKRAGLKR